jgi:hypothetical protein
MFIFIGTAFKEDSITSVIIMFPTTGDSVITITCI